MDSRSGTGVLPAARVMMTVWLTSGRDYQVAKKAVSEASDIREDKVAQLKNMVESGQYQVSGDDFASRLLEKYNSL